MVQKKLVLNTLDLAGGIMLGKSAIQEIAISISSYKKPYKVFAVTSKV